MTRSDVAKATALIEEENNLKKIEEFRGVEIVPEECDDVYESAERAVTLTPHAQFLVTSAIKQRISEIKAELENLGVK